MEPVAPVLPVAPVEPVVPVDPVELKTYNNGVTRGMTEWFYASPKQIENSFHDAFKIYGGVDYNTHLNEINKQADKNKKGSTYTAEIHCKIYK